MQTITRHNTIAADQHSLILNGERQLIISGAMHYPRSTPEMWPQIIRESKRAGLNCIETYVFWEGHEPEEGRFDFTGRFDLGRFLDVCQAEGMYAILRIGPYICAEWNFGGLPWWLVRKEGMVSRTYNKPFMDAMSRFVRVLLEQVGDRQFTQGGPIILAQMENEYNNVSKRYGEDGQRYLAWTAELGREAGLEVPLVMCYGASDDVIETLNGFTVWGGVDPLLKERPFQPAIWTENWPGWYDVWGQPHHLRRTPELTYEVTRFFAAGGSGVNYYMWYGGTNFGRDAMYLATTSYTFDGPLDEYGMSTTKSQSLAELHHFLTAHKAILLEGERGAKQILVHAKRDGEAQTEQTDEERLDGGRGDRPTTVEEEQFDEANGVVCYPIRHQGQELVFVINATYEPQGVSVRNCSEELPPRSAMAVISTGNESHIAYRSWTGAEKPITREMQPANVALDWQMILEPFPATGADAKRDFIPVTLPDNMLLHTCDETDFGWYRTVVHSPVARTATLTAGVADFLSVWVNGNLSGCVPERLKEDRPKREDFQQQIEIPLQAGRNELLLLVSALGMVKGDWMLDAPMTEEKKGLVAPVALDGEILAGPWEFSAGTWGERVKLPEPGPASLAAWQPIAEADFPLRWYRATFTLTEAQLACAPWALEIGDLFKGTLWINGHGLGRYWQLASPADTKGDEWGRDQFITVEGVGLPPQRYYHIPTAWLDAGENTLIVLEERGVAPGACGLVRRV